MAGSAAGRTPVSRPKDPSERGYVLFRWCAAVPSARVPTRNTRRELRSLTRPIILGLLHMLYSCVTMLFWRVFMRISYTCPEHLKFALTVDKWSELVQLTGSAIDWLNENDRMYDVWLLVAYCATSCALVQVRFGRRSRSWRALDANRRCDVPSTTPSRDGRTKKHKTS